jgi:hypothetical protein
MNFMSFEVIKYILFGTLLLTYGCRSRAKSYMGAKLDPPHLRSKTLLRMLKLQEIKTFIRAL